MEQLSGAVLPASAVESLVLPTLIKGGTGLYDTVLAGYSQAVRDYNENYYNTLVILTDGANDDPSSISLQDLLRELRTMHDPASPVRIVAVGISQDADMEALGCRTFTDGHRGGRAAHRHAGARRLREGRRRRGSRQR